MLARFFVDRVAASHYFLPIAGFWRAWFFRGAEKFVRSALERSGRSLAGDLAITTLEADLARQKSSRTLIPIQLGDPSPLQRIAENSRMLESMRDSWAVLRDFRGCELRKLATVV